MADPLAAPPGCATVPSATAAVDFLRGKPGAVPHLAVTMAGRTAIVALGLLAVGRRNRVWRDAFAAVIALELSIFALLLARGMPEGDPADFCPSLPTVDSAGDLLDGQPGAFLRVARDVVLRSGELGIGMWLAGAPRDRLVIDALGGSMSIEAFVLLWTWADRRTRARAAGILRSIP